MGLLSDLSKQDRVCLLDLAVFDWIDAELVVPGRRATAGWSAISSSVTVKHAGSGCGRA